MRRRWLVGTKRDRTSSGTFARNASQQIRADSCPSPCEQTTSATFAAGSVSVSVMASAHPPLGLLLRPALPTRRILRPTWDVYASCVESQYNPVWPRGSLERAAVARPRRVRVSPGTQGVLIRCCRFAARLRGAVERIVVGGMVFTKTSDLHGKAIEGLLGRRRPNSRPRRNGSDRMRPMSKRQDYS